MGTKKKVVDYKSVRLVVACGSAMVFPEETVRAALVTRAGRQAGEVLIQIQFESGKALNNFDSIFSGPINHHVDYLFDNK